jgi:hypothetical protein
MAQRVNIELVDDIDGSTNNVETVSFALDGATYEIDLSKKNADQLRKALAGYIEKGHRVSGRRGNGRRSSGGRRGRGRARSGGVGSASHMREWARTNGYQVSDRGRVPEEVRKAYSAAQGGRR